MRVKISELKTDEGLLDIRPVDPITESRYRIAMRCGAQFPKMIINKADMSVICGNHRLAAMRAEFGEDHVADVEIRTFRNRLEILRTFTEDNTKHGKPLTGFALHRCGFAMLNEGMSAEEVSKSLNIPMALFEKWGERTVGIIGKGRTDTVPVKAGLVVPGGKMTQKQYAEHVRRDLGEDIIKLSDQLTRWLENGWFSPDDESVMESLKALGAAMAAAGV